MGRIPGHQRIRKGLRSSVGGAQVLVSRRPAGLHPTEREGQMLPTLTLQYSSTPACPTKPRGAAKRYAEPAWRSRVLQHSSAEGREVGLPCV